MDEGGVTLLEDSPDNQTSQPLRQGEAPHPPEQEGRFQIHARRRPRRPTALRFTEIGLRAGIRARQPDEAKLSAKRSQPHSQQSRDESKTIRGRNLQWSYIHAKYTDPESPRAEALAAERAVLKRAFLSWKSKLGSVLEPKNPKSWPWREQGRWLFERENVPEMRKAWRDLELQEQEERWPLIMLSTLWLCPEKATMVLDATLDPLPPGYAIHDVLLFIAQRFKLAKFGTFRERAIKADELLELVSKIYEVLPHRHVAVGQRTFGIFAREFLSYHVKELYDMSERSGLKLHTNTLLHFARKLAGHASYKETAFVILNRLAENGVDLNDPAPASVITTLLYSKSTDDGWSPGNAKKAFSAQDALQALMEKGFVPNVINLTSFLDNLCRDGQFDEAVRLALLFSEAGIRLDSRACATIFSEAKDSLNADNVAKALEIAKVCDVPYIDVLNNVLHSTFYFAEMETRVKKMRAPWVLPLFVPLLHVYAKKFDLAPLQDWLPDSLPLLLLQDSPETDTKFKYGWGNNWDFQEHILPLADRFFSESNGPRLQPSSTTLAIMLRAYIKSLRKAPDLLAAYNFFKSRLVEQSSGKLLPLFQDQGSLIHDTFLLAILERKGLSQQALQIFGDMLKDHMKVSTPSDAKAQPDGDEDRPKAFIHPPPTIWTFNILVRGLLSQKERVLADQIIQVMQEQGVEPNLVTWNTLIKSYASVQNISKTVSTLQDLEATGLKPDIFTMDAFGKLRDQERAFKMMENIIDSNARQLADELA